MSCAQRLYEAGLITYMRTDSPTLSREAKTIARTLVNLKWVKLLHMDHQMGWVFTVRFELRYFILSLPFYHTLCKILCSKHLVPYLIGLDFPVMPCIPTSSLNPIFPILKSVLAHTTSNSNLHSHPVRIVSFSNSYDWFQP